MAFLQVAGSSGANVHGSDVTTHNINFTRVGAVSANDILLIAATINGNPTVTAPAGYGTLVDAANGGTNHKLVVFWLPQGATSFSTNAVGRSAGIVLHITGAHASTPPEVAAMNDSFTKSGVRRPERTQPPSL